MNTLKTWKRQIEEIEGIRYTLVEKGISEERMNFLKDVLEFNKFNVKVTSNEDATYTILVTDLLFNPILAVYDCSLKNAKGEVISPAYWNMDTKICDSRYWVIKRKKQ
ncbi:MAG: hypothetical protein WCK02_08715 [Bacteroidota bacterium]